jgi:hypothetical protein
MYASYTKKSPILALLVLLTPCTKATLCLPTISSEKLMACGIITGIALSLYSLWHSYSTDYISAADLQLLCNTIQDLDERISALECEVNTINKHLYDQCQTSAHAVRQVEAMQQDVRTLHAVIADCQTYIENKITGFDNALAATNQLYQDKTNILNENLMQLASRIDAIIQALNETEDLLLPNVIYNCEVHVHCAQESTPNGELDLQS